MIKKMKYGDEASALFSEGMLEVCSLLKETYGPMGGEVLVEQQDGTILLTRSSAAILQNMKMKNLFQDQSVMLAREAVLNCAQIAGDGTTLTAILMESMIKEAKKVILGTISPMQIRIGLQKALNFALHCLENMSEPMTSKELLKVAYAACGNKPIAQLVVQAYQKVGQEGMIMVKESTLAASSLEFNKGMVIQQGYISPSFLQHAAKKIEFKDPLILVTDTIISSFSELLPILEYIKSNQRPLLIVAENVVGEALNLLIHNVKEGIFQVAVVKAEGVNRRKQDKLEDLGIYTGAQVFRSIAGVCLENMLTCHLGSAKNVVIEKEKTIIVAGSGSREEIEARVRKIYEIIGDPQVEEYDKERHRERIGSMTSGFCTIYTAGDIKAERKENKRKAESAIRSIRGGLKKGVVTGGGVSLLKLIPALNERCIELATEYPEQAMGVKLLMEACKAPVSVLVQSVYGERMDIVARLMEMEADFGFHVEKEGIRNLKEEGIIDSVFVIQTALEQACSMVFEWLGSTVLMVSVMPDREDIELLKQGVQILR